MSKKPDIKGKMSCLKKVDKLTYVNKKIHMSILRKMLINMWIMWITIFYTTFRANDFLYLLHLRLPW